MVVSRRRFKLAVSIESSETANLYIIAGGSNAIGYASTFSIAYPYRDTEIESTEKIYVDGVGFQTLSLTNNQATIANNVGAELPLMKRLVQENPGEDIHLVKFCSDSSDMAYWLSTGLTQLKLKVLSAISNLSGQGKTAIIKGILWIQGEPDALSGRTKAQYRADMESMYTSLSTLASNIPIAVYQLNPNLTGGGSGLTNVRQAQKEFCDSAPDTRFLIQCDKNTLSSGTNLQGDGIVRMGLRAAMFLRANKNDPATDTQARYKGVFKILGTPEQRAFTLEVLPQIKFPLEELTYGVNASIGYASIINSGSLGITTGDGQITIEQTLVGNQERGRECIIHEVGHAVDSGLPVTTEQQNAIKTLVGCTTCTWYPDGDEFRSQYEEVLREAFPQYFITSYSDRFYTDGTHHPITPEQIPAFRAIMGYERTDA